MDVKRIFCKIKITVKFEGQNLYISYFYRYLFHINVPPQTVFQWRISDFTVTTDPKGHKIEKMNQWPFTPFMSA